MQNSYSGSQAFARYRERLYKRYEKGFEAYRKSEYFRQRADIARETASMEKLRDKGYLDRKIKECRKEVRDRKKNIERYEKILDKLENGLTVKRYDGTFVNIEEVINLLKNQLELIEVVQDKEAFLIALMI